jgi:hypothetical protein
MLLLHGILSDFAYICHKNITRTNQHCLLLKAIIQPLRFSQNALWLTNNLGDYKHKSVSSPAIDLLLASYSVFDNIGTGAQRLEL